MDRFEFAVGLFSVIIGLALSDMAMSVHRLLKRAHEVRWAALPVATAVFVALGLVAMWYELWGVQSVRGLTSFWFYASLVAELFVLFLAAAAVLPDERDGVDLAVYFDRHQRYIWTLMLLFQATFSAHWIYFRLVKGAAFPGYWDVAAQFTPFGAYVALLLIRNRPVQLVLVLGLIVKLLVDYVPASL